jgi:hypothetical protein
VTEHAHRRERPSASRTRIVAWSGLGVAVAGAVAAGVLVVTAFVPGGAAQQYLDPDESIVEPQPGQEAPAAGTPAAPAPVQLSPGQPVHLSIPAAHLEATVGAMSIPADRDLDPPTPNSAYWVRNYAAAGPDSKGTAYIIGHTFRGTGRAVFNALFDLGSRRPVIGAGDEMSVRTPEGTWPYRITEVASYDKSALPGIAQLWENVPGRLVLVACQYNGAKSATQNLVVYSQLDRGP